MAAGPCYIPRLWLPGTNMIFSMKNAITFRAVLRLRRKLTTPVASTVTIQVRDVLLLRTCSEDCKWNYHFCCKQGMMTKVEGAVVLCALVRKTENGKWPLLLPGWHDGRRKQCVVFCILVQETVNGSYRFCCKHGTMTKADDVPMLCVLVVKLERLPFLLQE